MTNNSAVSEFVFKYIAAAVIATIVLMVLGLIAVLSGRPYIIYGSVALIGVGATCVAIKTALDDPIGMDALHLPASLFITLLCLMAVCYGAYGS